MSNFLDRLNLGPQERRIVVAAVAVLFVMLNAWFVWPHFKDWGRVQEEVRKAEKTLREYDEVVAKLKDYEQKRSKLESADATVASSDQALQLQKIVQKLASNSKVNVRTWNSSGNSSAARAAGLKPNQFFEEQTLKITISETGDKELLDFLVALGVDNSMIRVRDLDLKPDQSQMKLMGSITLVASYQVNPSPKPGKTTARLP